jgi:protein arginine N-methyltransferase 7
MMGKGNPSLRRHTLTDTDDRYIMSEAVHTLLGQAIQSARYNEAVVVTFGDDGQNLVVDGRASDDHGSEVDANNGSNSGRGGTREIVLVACLDAENGGIVWRDAAAAVSSSATTGDGDNLLQDDIGILRHLRTKRWALPMLNDHRRNEMYSVAVKEACDVVVERRLKELQLREDDGIATHGEGDVDDGDEGRNNVGDETIRILDIGSGTGLLAMMGARHTQNAIKESSNKSTDATILEDIVNTSDASQLNVRVTSVEMASAMARLARMTVHENGFTSDNVVVVEHHSSDVEFGIDDRRFQSSSSSAGGGDGGDMDASVGTKVKQQQKADICTSELLESGLLGEGVLPAMRDAWKRHLKDDAVVVPTRARVKAVLVEGMTLGEEDGGEKTTASLNSATSFFGPELHSFEEASGGVWFNTRAPTSTSNEGNCLRGISVPLHANAMINEDYGGTSLASLTQEYDGYSLHPSANRTLHSNEYRGIRVLTEPVVVLDFDFASGVDAIPPPEGRTVTTQVVPNTDGTVHGVLFWWELDMGAEDSGTYSTEPIGYNNSNGSDNWQDHWQQVLYLFGDDHFRREDEMTRQVVNGRPVDVVASHDDGSISFDIKNAYTTTDASRPSQRRKLNEEDKDVDVQPRQMTNANITPTRALQLNDSQRTRILHAAIFHALETKGKDAPLLDLSDMGLCAMMAAVQGATRVTSLESSSGTMPTLAATIAQIGNKLPKQGCEFQIIQALAEHITSEYIVGGIADIVVAEPYYEMLEGWHLQEALNYFYLVRSLKMRNVISPKAVSVPAEACIMGCVVQFDEFYNAYGKVGDKSGGSDEMVQGFSHRTLNHYGDRYHTYDVSLPLWQYQWKRLSKTFCVSTLSYEGETPTIRGDKQWVVADFERTGTCQAVVFFVDYLCRVHNGTHSNQSNGDRFGIISTSSSSHRQTVRKLASPIEVTEADLIGGIKFHCRASFESIDPNYNDNLDDHMFSFKVIKRGDDDLCLR